MTTPGGTGFSRGKTSQAASQLVAILSIDAASNTATGLTRRETHVEIDLSYHVGAVQVTPSAGEQWMVKLLSTPRGTQYILDHKVPFNTPETLTPTTEGQQQIGNTNGPIQLHGTQINANGVLRLASGTTLDGVRRMGGRRGDSTLSGLPDASGVDSGSLAYDEQAGTPTYSDGTNWNPLATQDQVQSKYTLPPGGIPQADLGSTVQNALTLAGTALQNIPDNSVGSSNIQSGAVGTTQLSSGVQTSLGLANTALQSLSGSPYDLSIVVFGAISMRTTGTGDNPFGVKIQRACTLSSVTYRCATADASGSMTVELRRNGATIPGTSTTILAANQLGGGTATFTQVCNVGDVLTVYVTNVGANPGVGLVADIAGVMN